eukprot:TRINITY_DN4539_c0_g1_i2.p2 TRINITY_DN4539_c0_g1~~TRINITY_DN4539_c0_g1_i2.p2  ORF type:complete len:171 (-),score=38.67 TRINITY_DN4539_c0_g1_i2:279-791(-)
MMAQYKVGTFDDIHEESIRLSQKYMEHGFNVVRTKIEALCSNEGVPESDEESQKYPNNYFEFHVKLHLSDMNDDKWSLLRGICKQHDAHLSRNAFKIQGSDGTGDHVDSKIKIEERFITIRLYNVGKVQALDKLEKCIEHLKCERFSFGKAQREYSVYDSYVKLDDGWIG